MIVGGGYSQVPTPLVQGIKIKNLEFSTPTPSIVPEVKTETPKESPTPKKHCFIFYCW
jgi:hypothetical protein